MSKSIETAIRRSISHNEIVTLEWTADREAALLDACEDSVATSVLASTDRIEAWGRTDDGNEWRVHLDGRA